MIDIPGDLVQDLPCMQQASHLEGDPLVWMLPLYRHVYQQEGDGPKLFNCVPLLKVQDGCISLI